MYNQGLRICNTQTIHLPINIMTNDHQLQMLRDIQQAVNTPEWMLEAEAQEQGWVTDDEDTAEQWWNSQHTDCDIPFWVPGVSRGIESPTQLLPPAEMGTAQQENPVATVNTVHTLQLTTEEVYMLARAMSMLNEPTYDDIEACYPSIEAAALEKLLFSVVPLENWVRKHGTGRCKSSLSYYHPPRVVTLLTMAIRKAIANQLSNAAKALEKDQSKEQAGRLINGIRISLANVIMPNIPLSK